MDRDFNGTPEEVVARILELVTSEETLLAGLSQLLKVFKNHEQNVEVLKVYLQRSNECSELLGYFKWERSKQTSEGLILCFELLETVLLFTASSTGHFHSVGVGVVQNVLQNHMRVVYSALAGAGTRRLVLLALRLLTSLVMQSGGCARDVFTLFDFSYKYLESISCHTKGSNRPGSIRRCFINFALSFLIVGSADVVEGILGIKRFLTLVLRDLHKDASEVAQVVLTVLREKVAQNEAVGKKAKSLFFVSSILSSIAQFLTLGDGHLNVDDVETEQDLNEMDLPLCSYHLLTVLCTNFRMGICYKPKWDQTALMKTNNPNILGFVLSLANHLEQKLVSLLTVKIISTCPDLLLPYLRGFPFSLEPRQTEKYLVAVEFVLKLYSSLPELREVYKFLKSHDLSHDMPPIPVLLGYCIPPVYTRTFLSAGLQSQSPLVKHYSLAVIGLCLKRALPLVEEDGAIDGGERWREFKDELFRLLPDVKTLITLHHNLVKGKASPEEVMDSLSSELDARNKELMEGDTLLAQVLDVMSSLQTLRPLVFLQAGFDAGKLLAAGGSPPLHCWHSNAILTQTLKFLSTLPKGALKWYQQGNSSLRTITGLVFLSDVEVVRAGLKVLERILCEIPLLGSHHFEIKLVLSVLHDQSVHNLHNSAGRSEIGDLFASVFLHLMRDHKFSSKIVSEVSLGVAQGGPMPDVLGVIPYAFLVQMTGGHQYQQQQQQKQGPTLLFVGEILQKFLHLVSYPGLLSKLFYDKLVSEDFQHLVDPAFGNYYLSLVRFFALTSNTPLETAVFPPSSAPSGNGGLSLKKRFKEKSGQGGGSAHAESVQAFIGEMLSTPLESLVTEVPKALKWTRKHCSSQIYSSLCHVVSLLPFKLTPALHQVKHLPLSAILNGLILSDEPRHQSPTACPPPRKRRSFVKPHLLGCSVMEVVSAHGDLISTAVMDSRDMQSDLVYSGSIVRTYLLSLLTILDSDLEVGVESGTLQNAISFVSTLLLKLLTNIASLDSEHRFFETATAVVNSLFSAPQFKDCLMSHVPTHNECKKVHVRKRPHPFDKSYTDVSDIARKLALFTCAVAKLSPLWKNGHGCEGLLSQVMESTVNNPHVWSLGVVETLFPLLNHSKKAFVFSQYLNKSLALLKDKTDLGWAEVILKCLASCLTTSTLTDRLQQPEDSNWSRGTPGHEEQPSGTPGQEEQPSGTTGGKEPSFVIPVDSVVGIMSVLAEQQETCPLVEILEHLLLKIFQCNHSHPSGIQEEDELPGKLATIAKSMLHHLEEYTRITHTPVPPLLRRAELVRMSRMDRTSVLGIDSVGRDIIEKYCALVLLRPRPVSVEIGAVILDNSCLAVNWLEQTGIELLSQSNPSPNCTELLLPLVNVYLQQSQLENNSNLLGILVDILWDRCCEIVLNSESSVVPAGETLQLLISSACHKKLNKREKKLLKKLLRLRGDEGGSQWMSSHLKLLEVLVPLLGGKTSHLHLLSSVLLWLLRDFKEVITLEEGGKSGADDPLCRSAILAIRCYRGHLQDLHTNHILDNPEFCELSNSIVKQVLRVHFCNATFIDLLCELVAVVYSSNNGSSGSDVIPGGVVAEMVWSHSQFLEVMLCNLGMETLNNLLLVKSCIVKLLVHLAEFTNLTKAHVPILLAAYQGTLKDHDRGLLFLMNHYESRGMKMEEFRPFVFGRSALENYQSKQRLGWLLWKEPSLQEVLSVLEREKMFCSTVRFPLEKDLEPTNPFSAAETTKGSLSFDRGDEDIYDPSFLLPFFAHHLQPGFVVDCQAFVETGCWGYVVLSLSSFCKDVRGAACHCLSLFKSHLEGARFREKSQIVLLMEILQNSLVSEDSLLLGEVDDMDTNTSALTSAPQRLLSAHAQLFVKLSSVFLRPENDLYPVLGQFVVYRPNLDLKTLPFANLLFYSSSPQATKERVWILKVLVDGLRTEEDYKLYKKLGILSSAMAFWHSAIMEPETKSLIVQLLQQATLLTQGLRDLVKRQGLFSWFHRALLDLKDPNKQRELLLLSCDTWEKWVTMVTEAAEDKGYIPYPHQIYQMSMIMTTVAMEILKPAAKLCADSQLQYSF